MCGGRQYKQEYTLTEGSSVEIRVLGLAVRAEHNAPQFLIHYQGKEGSSVEVRGKEGRSEIKRAALQSGSGYLDISDG